MDYDSLHDKHLRTFFRRPVVEKQLMRYQEAVRLERRPKYLRDFAVYLSSSDATSGSAEAAPNCLCGNQRTCSMCRCHAGRSETLQRATRLSDPGPHHPLSPFEELAAKLSSSSRDSSRPQSACSARQDSRPTSRSSSRGPSRQQQTSVSRPSSVNSKLRASSRQNVNPRIESSNHSEKAPSHCPRQSAAPTIKHVHFDTQPEREDLSSASSVVNAPCSVALPRKTLSSSAELDFGFVDPVCDLMLAAPQSACTKPGDGADDPSQTEVLPPSVVKPPRIPRTHSSSRSKRPQTSAPSVSSVVTKPDAARCEIVEQNGPETFVLLRFTAKQLQAAVRLQSWTRGLVARRHHQHRQSCARKIQRWYRRLLQRHSTAVAVWTFAKDARGRWLPSSTFCDVPCSADFSSTNYGFRMSQLPNLIGRKSLLSPVAPTKNSSRQRLCSSSLRETPLVDFHHVSLASLGHIMRVLVEEPQVRMALLAAADADFCSIAAACINDAEHLVRHHLDAEERLSLREVHMFFEAQLRFMQRYRKLLLTREVAFEQLVVCESSARCALTNAAHRSEEICNEPKAREAISSRALCMSADILMAAVPELESTSRHDMERAAFVEVADILSIEVASRLFSEWLAVRSQSLSDCEASLRMVVTSAAAAERAVLERQASLLIIVLSTTKAIVENSIAAASDPSLVV